MGFSCYRDLCQLTSLIANITYHYCLHFYLNALQVGLVVDRFFTSDIYVCAGAFDQHGCPLIMFPVEGQAKLSTELSKAEVVDFIKYFQFVHKYVGCHCATCVSGGGAHNALMLNCFLDSKKLEKESLVSVVADLRHASLHTVRFIAETLLLLEVAVVCCRSCMFSKGDPDAVC